MMNFILMTAAVALAAGIVTAAIVAGVAMGLWFQLAEADIPVGQWLVWAWGGCAWFLWPIITLGMIVDVWGRK
jgi:hypothetical protein